MSGSSLNGDPAEDDDGPEDKTADDLFQELADDESSLGTSADGDEIYEELAGESPEEIIAAADEDVEEHPVDDAILPDEDALQELLLSDRTEEDGFLWIDTGGEAESDDDDPFDEDVVEEWSDAFAAASDGPSSTDDRPTVDVEGGSDGVDWTDDESEDASGAGEAGDAETASESDDSGPGIEIEVPDPDEVEGARPDDGAESSRTGDLDEDQVDDADSEATTTDDGDEDPDSRVFDVDPDDEALASTVGDGRATDDGEDSEDESSAPTGDDDDTRDDDASPGLIARVLSLLPF